MYEVLVFKSVHSLHNALVSMGRHFVLLPYEVLRQGVWDEQQAFETNQTLLIYLKILVLLSFQNFFRKSILLKSFFQVIDEFFWFNHCNGGHEFFMGDLFVVHDGDFCGSRYECSSFSFENSCHLLGVYVILLLSAEGVSPPVFYSLAMVDLYPSASQCFGPPGLALVQRFGGGESGEVLVVRIYYDGVFCAFRVRLP